MTRSSKRLPPITTLVEDIGDLRAFGLVVDLKSVTAAASVLGESKATTSRRISRIEASLGVPLLHRTSRVVEVTEQGRTYRSQIGEVLELLAHANANARNVHDEPHGTLRIAAPPGLVRFLGQLVANFALEQPDVRVDVELSDKVLDLDVEEIDLAFGFATDAESVEVVELTLICVATAAYLKQFGRPQTPADLKKHKVIAHRWLGERDATFTHQQTKRPTHVRLQPTVLSQASDFIIDIACRDAGIAIVPALIAHADLQAGHLVRVLPSYVVPTRSLYMRLRRARHLPSKVAAFRDFVKTYITTLSL